MAQTYKIADALNIISRQLGRQAEDDFAAHIANMAMNEIWLAYDWRESLAELPPFYLVPSLQDHGAPFYAVPADFLGLREVYASNTFNPTQRFELKPIRDVRLTGSRGLPRNIGYEPSTQSFRVFPRVPDNIGATEWIVDGTYKKKPAKITVNTLQTTSIPWDDIYFNVFVAALKWAAWDAAGDPRAGEIQYSNGRAIMTGQLGKMHEAIDAMAANEGLNLGDPVIAPSEALVTPLGFVSPNIPGLGIY